MTGDRPSTLRERDKIFAEFQDTPKYKVLLAHPACMAHSLTLTRASTTLWAGPVTSLDTFTQANGRIYRVGQQNKTLVGMIGGTAAERKMYKLLGQNDERQTHFLRIVEAITAEET